ncbi:MAG: hypothetical protein KC646_11040 [Candidatus Cloacimonetes bacterium]|nr:hypothetical protein [Candidatus Cloacimonadota bacterium]
MFKLFSILFLLILLSHCSSQNRQYWDEVLLKRTVVKAPVVQQKRKHKFWMADPKVDFSKPDLPEETEKYIYYKPNDHIDHTSKRDNRYSGKKLRLEYKKRERFRVIQPRISKLYGYQTTISNRISYTQWKEHNLLSYYDSSIAQFSQKKPYDRNKLTNISFSFGLQKYLSKRLFFQPELGVKTFVPDANTKAYTKTAFSNEYDPKFQGYLQLTLSYQLLKKIPLVNRPLRLNGSYTFAKDHLYPVQNFMYALKDQGLSFGASIQFKI